MAFRSSSAARGANSATEYFVLLDVGGTSVKGYLSETDDFVIIKSKVYPAMAQASSDIIFRNFCNIIADLSSGRRIVRIGMAFPGPFDYENGISLMNGINKYDAIYGKSIPDSLSALSPDLKDVSYSFLNDVEAFALGCVADDKSISDKRVFCLCIGTGAGSAFVENGRIRKTGDDIPQNGWITYVPFRSSIMDDYISERGLEKEAENTCGERYTGKELFEKCRKSDSTARLVFRKFGETLTEALSPVLDRFHPDDIIIGGNISKSFEYFGDDMKKYCKERQIGLKLQPDTSKMAAAGLFHELKQKL